MACQMEWVLYGKKMALIISFFAWMGDTASASMAMPFTDIELYSNDDFALGDLDGDGDTDILVATSEEGLALIWNEWSIGGNFLVETEVLPLPRISSSSEIPGRNRF